MSQAQTTEQWQARMDRRKSLYVPELTETHVVFVIQALWDGTSRYWATPIPKGPAEEIRSRRELAYDLLSFRAGHAFHDGFTTLELAKKHAELHQEDLRAMGRLETEEIIFVSYDGANSSFALLDEEGRVRR